MPNAAPQSPVFVVAVYGQKYAAFLGPHLTALRAAYPDRPAGQVLGHVLWQHIEPREIAVLAAVFPEFNFEETALPESDDSAHAIPRKIHAWARGAQLAGDRPVAFLDCDAILVAPIDDYFADQSWDITFTWKDELFPINTGVMLARRGDLAAHVFAAMLPRIERMVTSREQLATAVGSSGAADQHALREIIGFCNYDRTITREVEANGVTRPITFRGEPCSVLNETNCRPITRNLRIIHYKTGWHPILLNGANFTVNRPELACAEMFGYWRELEQRAGDLVAAELTRSAAAAAADRFAPIAGGYEERGILHSEMLAVCGVCEALDVDVIIESGRCRGQSTLVLARYFERSDCEIVSVELERDENADFAEARLASFANVELLFGDSGRVLPELIERFAGRRIALLIDGPKGIEALNLVHKAFALSPDVAAAFVHDMRIDTPQRAAVAGYPFRAFHTDDEQYRRAFERLDDACLPAPGQEITMHTWRPFLKGHDAIPGYGPTLGVYLPRPSRPAAAAQTAQRTARPITVGAA